MLLLFTDDIIKLKSNSQLKIIIFSTQNLHIFYPLADWVHVADFQLHFGETQIQSVLATFCDFSVVVEENSQEYFQEYPCKGQSYDYPEITSLS